MASVVVIEPWYGGSHRAWLDGWVAASRHDVATITSPDRFWRWRMRGGAVEFADRFAVLIDERGRPDAVVVSSLLDVAAFIGLARRSLGATPVALYMHENQALYPSAPNQRPNDDMALVNWKSLIAADEVWWNTGYHRDALLAELPVVLKRQPDEVALDSLDTVRQASRVLWPGVALADLIGSPKPTNRVPVVLWNQRWDHDKNPRSVFSSLGALADAGVAFEVVLAGENHGHVADDDWVEARLGSRIRSRGFLDDDAYRRALLESDVVVSAADHEFFGIAIVEAIAAGAVPVLPDRLSYPEIVGDRHRSALYPHGELRARLREVLRDLGGARAEIDGLRQSMERFDVVHTAAAHDDAVDRLVGAPDH